MVEILLDSRIQSFKVSNLGRYVLGQGAIIAPIPGLLPSNLGRYVLVQGAIIAPIPGLLP